MHKANAQKEGIEGSRSCQKRHKSCKKTCKKTGKQIVAVIVLYLIIVQLVVPQIVVLIVPLIVVVRIVILSTFIVILSTFIVVAHSLLPTTCNRTSSSSVVFFCLASASLPNLCLQGCRLLSASPSPFPFLLLHSLSPEAKKQPEKKSRIANKRPQFVSLKKWDRKDWLAETP